MIEAIIKASKRSSLNLIHQENILKRTIKEVPKKFKENMVLEKKFARASPNYFYGFTGYGEIEVTTDSS